MPGHRGRDALPTVTGQRRDERCLTGADAWAQCTEICPRESPERSRPEALGVLARTWRDDL